MNGLASEISDTEPRYSFFRYSDESTGEEPPPVIFVYTCPSASKIKERMVYASSKLTFVEAVKAEAGLNIVKSVGPPFGSAMSIHKTDYVLVRGL